MNSPEGHRERLRQKFKDDPRSISDTERLELLLTYIIPRRDIAPLARDLMERFGSLRAVMSAPAEQLMEIEGVGSSTATFILLLQSILDEALETQFEMSPNKQSTSSSQLELFDLKPEVGNSNPVDQATRKRRMAKERPMRVFANDEIENSLRFLPQAANFRSLEDFKKYLTEKLPYNASETRQRRANNIIERFFAGDKLDTPLIYFAAHCSTEADLKPVVFYHVLKAEPIAAKVAEEFIWPALPTGRVEREQMREFILRYLPEASNSSQQNMLRALFYTYDLLGIGSTQDTSLRFQLHQGTVESCLYILTNEYPKPGIYSFDGLFSGPIHRWLLWDREWLRNQLYNLQDFGILTKVSEIDSVRQFTLAVDQPTALRQFFQHPARSNIAIRETAKGQSADQGE
jgi:hypothetical protein